MTKSPPFVFISYSRQDQAYVKNLVQAFEHRGVSVWIDDAIDCGDLWSQAIWQHLKACEAFVIVMTPRARKSNYVECELIVALEKRKKIFPILLEGERWYNLANKQYVDVKGGAFPPDSFFETVKAFISNTELALDSSASILLSDDSKTVAVTQKNSDSEDFEENEFETLRRELAAQKNSEWAGDWFVNVGEGDNRTWEDCVKYGFMSAGQGTTYSNSLKNLKIGSTIYAYMSGLGYVGLGKVTSRAVPIKDFSVGKEDTPLLDMDLLAEKPGDNSENLELSEWVVGVKWLKTFPKDRAQRFVGAFANQNVVCKLRNRRTLEFLHEKFGWAGNWFVNVGVGKNQRSWEDCVRYGFISAGQGPQFAQAIRRLEPGNTVYAYVSGSGYVGFGEVVEGAVPIKAFTVESDNSSLLSMDLKAQGLDLNSDDPELSEWVVRMKWLKTYSREQARRFDKAFVYPGTLCHLNDQRTLSLLHREFSR